MHFAALALDLELPFWSFATVYVVAHPPWRQLLIFRFALDVFHGAKYS